MAVAKRYFKIRHKVTGLYSSGGSDAAHSSDGVNSSVWKKNGKIWAGTGPLRSHLALIVERRGNMENWEVVELALTEISGIPAVDMISQEQLARMLKHDYQNTKLYSR